MDVEKKLEFDSAITAVISDDKTTYVSLEDGRVVFF